MERKPHFLDDHVQQLKDAGELNAEHPLGALWYNRHGDCVMFLSVNEGVVADWIDEYLTIYRSAVDERPVGFQLKGIKALMAEFDYDLAHVQAQIESDEVQAITLNMMLMKSFQKKDAQSVKRFRAYVEAMTVFPHIAASEKACR